MGVPGWNFPTVFGLIGGPSSDTALSTLDQMNVMVAETRWGDRDAPRGDITRLNFPIDLMIISSRQAALHSRWITGNALES